MTNSETRKGGALTESLQEAQEVRNQDSLQELYSLSDYLATVDRWLSPEHDLSYLFECATSPYVRNTRDEKEIKQQCAEKAHALRTELEDVKKKLSDALNRLFASQEVQDSLTTSTGEVVQTVEQATQLARKLLAPWYQRYRVQYKKLGKKTKTSTDSMNISEREKTAARSAIPVLVPQELDPQDQDGLTAWQMDQELWEKTVQQLAVLPSPYTKAARSYVSNRSATSVLALFRINGVLEEQSDSKKKERFLTIEIGAPDYTNADLQDLQSFLKKVSSETELILNRLPPITSETSISPTLQSQVTPEITSLPVAERSSPTRSISSMRPETNTTLPEFRRVEGEPTFERTYAEMRELLGNQFFGIEAAVQALTLQNNTRLLELTPEEQQQVIRELHEKVQAPDIQLFLRRMRDSNDREVRPEDWLLVYRPTFILIPQTNEDILSEFGAALDRVRADGVVGQILTRERAPLTMQRLFEQVQPDMRARNQGNLLFNTQWYQVEPFYTHQVPGNRDLTVDAIRSNGTVSSRSWSFVSKSVIRGSLGQQHAEQTRTLQNEARRVGLNVQQVRRRIPVEAMWDQCTVVRNTNARERLFVDPFRYDWTDVRTSDGILVRVGSGDAVGLDVGAIHPSHSLEILGAALVR